MRNNSGQVLLIILLVMVVGLTMGLSLATRSTTDVKVSTQLEQSSRAFSAAEAGIEAALKGEVVPGACSTDITIGTAVYKACVETAAATANPLAIGNIGLADTFTLWLTEYDTVTGKPVEDKTKDYAGTTIDVCWKKVSGALPADPAPAMEITLIYKDQTNNYKITRGAYDQNATFNNNNFTVVNSKDCGFGSTDTYGVTFDFNLPTPTGNNILIMLRLRPFYADADVAVKPAAAATLPAQGLTITATGTAGNTTRKVSVLESFPAPPAIFDYVLFSEQGVTKN